MPRLNEITYGIFLAKGAVSSVIVSSCYHDCLCLHNLGSLPPLKARFWGITGRALWVTERQQDEVSGVRGVKQRCEDVTLDVDGGIACLTSSDPGPNSTDSSTYEQGRTTVRLIL